MTATHIAIESTLSSGRKVYRFVEGTKDKSLNFAREQVGRFRNKPDVVGCRVFDVTPEEMAELREKAKADRAE